MRRILTSLIFLTAAAAPAAASTVLVDGSFETGILASSPELWPDTPDGGNLLDDLASEDPGAPVLSDLRLWRTVYGTAPIVHSGAAPDGMTAQDGQSFVQLDTGEKTAISQRVSSGIGDFILSFWYSPMTGDAETNTVNFAFGNLVRGTVTAGTNGAAPGLWTYLAYAFSSTREHNYGLNFWAFGEMDGVGGYIDNVRIDRAPEPAPVPLPSAGLLFAGALGGLALARRRAA
jgi:hypothetical protein